MIYSCSIIHIHPKFVIFAKKKKFTETFKVMVSNKFAMYRSAYFQRLVWKTIGKTIQCNLNEKIQHVNVNKTFNFPALSVKIYTNCYCNYQEYFVKFSCFSKVVNIEFGKKMMFYLKKNHF